jgi:hypothetical protein
LSLIGFSEVELDALLPGAETLSEDDAPVEFDETVPAVSQIGDVWILEDHRVMCGDSCDASNVDALFDGTKPNLMVTDPPYGVEYDPDR